MNSKYLIVIFAVVIIAIFIGITQIDFEDKPKKTTISPVPLYEDNYSFSDDPFGNHQKWCEENKGIWDDASISCGFVHHKDALRAHAILEDLQKQKITGKYADAICDILQIPCPENVEFEGHVNLNTNYIGYNYVSKKLDYSFKILNQQLEFKGNKLIDGTWYTTGDEYGVWAFPGEEPFPVIEDFSRTFRFDSDELGNYGKWCGTHNGIYGIEDVPNQHHSYITCEYTTEKDYTLAREGLHKLKKKTLSPELSQKLCAAYGKECASGITITMDYDMETGYLLKSKKIDDSYMEFRIIENDIIQYRIPQHPPLSWTTFVEK